jgi:competence protein ComEA
MLRTLRLTAALLAGLALPALAQTTSTTTPSTRPGATTASPAARPSAAAPAAAAGKRIDINSASENEIATLPGIGPAISKNIVQGRPWDDLNDLVKKKAVPQPVYDRNKDRFALANINTSSAADMTKTLPGIGDKTAPKIVNGRPYATPQDLVSKKVLTEGQFQKIKDVITY